MGFHGKNAARGQGLRGAWGDNSFVHVDGCWVCISDCYLCRYGWSVNTSYFWTMHFYLVWLTLLRFLRGTFSCSIKRRREDATFFVLSYWLSCRLFSSDVVRLLKRIDQHVFGAQETIRKKRFKKKFDWNKKWGSIEHRIRVNFIFLMIFCNIYKYLIYLFVKGIRFEHFLKFHLVLTFLILLNLS